MSYVGFRRTGDEVVEYLPVNEQLTSKEEKRIIFFNLFNYYVDKSLRFTKAEMLNGNNIYSVFNNKINALSENSIERIRLESLVSMNNGELLLNLDDMFLHLVYERAKLVNKDAEVLLFEKSIVIRKKEENVSPTLLIPSYAKVSKESIYGNDIVSEHLETVLKTLKETEIRQIYLVYPKHDKFKKHLTIKLMDKVPLAEEEYRVKMIPYSFSFCTRVLQKSCST